MSDCTFPDSYQVTLTGGVDTVDASGRGGAKFILKNPNAAGGNVMYVGPATNQAAAALSSTTGYVLKGGESVELDLVTSGSTLAARKLSVIGTASDKLHVLVLHP